MARKRTNEKIQARPFFATRLFLMLCAFLCGGVLGGGATEYALSFRREKASFASDAPRRLPVSDDEMIQGRMNVNTAAASDFQQARGIGPTLAQAIVAYRESVGGFYFLEELKDVPGIGSAKFEALKALFYCLPNASP